MKFGAVGGAHETQSSDGSLVIARQALGTGGASITQSGNASLAISRSAESGSLSHTLRRYESEDYGAAAVEEAPAAAATAVAATSGPVRSFRVDSRRQEWIERVKSSAFGLLDTSGTYPSPEDVQMCAQALAEVRRSVFFF